MLLTARMTVKQKQYKDHKSHFNICYEALLCSESLCNHTSLFLTDVSLLKGLCTHLFKRDIISLSPKVVRRTVLMVSSPHCAGCTGLD